MFSPAATAPDTPLDTAPAPLRLARIDAGAQDSACGPDRSVDALIEQAQLAERGGQRETARVLYERALYSLRGHADAASVASALLRWVGRTYQVDADGLAALDCGEAALAVAEAAADEAAIGHAVNMQATVLWQQGQLDQAERLFLTARQSALHSGDARLAAITAQNLGVLANVRGDFESALTHYALSLDDYRALGLVPESCGLLNNLGMLYTDLERWAEAEAAFTEAVETSAALDDTSMRMISEFNLADMWLARGEVDRAAAHCADGLAIAERTRDTQRHGQAFRIYGVIARERGDYASAEAHFTTAATIAEERHDLLSLAEVLRERADLHGRQGRNRETLHCLNRAHRLFAQLRAQRELADLDRRTRGLEGEFIDVVRRWGASIESKDRYTQGHCERVADIACALAAESGLDSISLFWFRIGALLHDVGKLMIPTAILNKPEKLTAEEWVIVKRHPEAGVEMLAGIDFPWDVRPLVESHHERWDGTGYPHGLRGESIPFTARILALADVYDALTSDRSYKRAFTHREAMEIMRADSGRVFDPEMFTRFETLLTRAGPPAPRRMPADATASDAITPALREVALEDDLTGLPMRRAFVDFAARALVEGQATGRPVSLLVIDIDHFKLVNDTYGHLQGDDALRLVADALRARVRASDVVGRYAGDEFAVLMPDTPLAVARDVAEALREAMHTARCPLRDRSGSATLGMTLSIGVAAAPVHGVTFETLFATADRALYDAKRRGRDAVAVAGAADGGAPPLHLDRFVGRAAEVRRLIRLLDQSALGRPAIAGLAGEAGVGKTTLVRQLTPEVRLRGGLVVRGRCLEGDVHPPYGPWADVIRELHAAGAVPPRAWSELPRLVPGLAAARALPGEGERTTGSRHALLAEVAAYLRAAAADRIVVVTLDDMQWADAATWDMLDHVVAGLDRERLFICLTVRVEDVGEETATRRRRLSRDERYHEFSIARLALEDVATWVSAVFQTPDLSAELPAFLYRQSEGNPLLAAQFLHALLEEDAVKFVEGRWSWQPRADLRLPVGVSDLMMRRLARLSPETRTILVTAAVVGRVFDASFVQVAAGIGEDALLDALDEAMAASVVEPSGDPASGEFSFTHGLLVDAARRAANPMRLRRAHERVAQELERRAPHALAELAAHYDHAGNSPRALACALRAADRARGLYAHVEAHSLLAIAQRHAATIPELADVRLRMALVEEASGRYADAEVLCDAAIAWLADGSDVLLSITARRARERLRILRGQRPHETLRALRDLLAEAEAARADEERIVLLGMISQAHSRLGDWPAAERIARECVEFAGPLGDLRLLAETRLRLATALLDVQPAEAVQLYTSALAFFAAADDLHGQTRCYINLGVAYDRLASGADAEKAYLIARQMGREAHAPELAGLAALNLGVWYYRAGRYEGASERLDEALRLFTAIGNEPLRVAAVYNLAHLASARGAAGEALVRYRDSVTLGAAIGQTDMVAGARAGAGLSALAVGRVDEAAQYLAEVNALVAGRDDWWFQGREMADALAVRMMLAGGDARAAEARFGDARALADGQNLYAAIWLVTECMEALAAGGCAGTAALAATYAPRAQGLGCTTLAARLLAHAAVG